MFVAIDNESNWLIEAMSQTRRSGRAANLTERAARETVQRETTRPCCSLGRHRTINCLAFDE